MAVPGGPGHRLGDLRQAAEGPAIPGEAFLQDHNPLEPALPFTHEQRAGLQTPALARLRRAAIERSADAVLFPRAKDPSDRFVEIAKSVRLQPTGQHPYQKPAWKMGRRFATQVGAPLTAQPIEIKALKIGNDRQNRGIERQRSLRCWRRRSLRRLPGAGARAGHADYVACVAFRWGSRLRKECATERAYGQRVGCANSGPSSMVMTPAL